MIKKSAAPNLTAWMNIDERRAVTGAFPQPKNNDDEIYAAVMRDCDANKALALSSRGDADPYLKVRAFVYAGRLSAAQAELSKLTPGMKETPEKAELLLEQARSFAYEGRWEDCEATSTDGLACAPRGLSMLALHQTRALARFEIGNMSDAVNDLQMARALHSIVPFSHSYFYAQAIESRIRGRDGKPSDGLLILINTWKALLDSNQLNIDLVSSLMRAEVEIRRLAGEDTLLCALASAAVNATTGESLFEGLALVDAWYAASNVAKSLLRNKLRSFEERFSRIKKLMDALEKRAEWNCSSVLGFKGPQSCISDSLEHEKIEELLKARSILFSDHKTIIHLKPFSIIRLKSYPAVIKSLNALKNGRIERSEYFRRMWGQIRYAPSLHDSWIAKSLYRVRKLSGAQISNQSRQIEMTGVIVL